MSSKTSELTSSCEEFETVHIILFSVIYYIKSTRIYHDLLFIYEQNVIIANKH